MVDGYGPQDVIKRPGVGRDPGVTARPSTSLAVKIDNPIGTSLLGLSKEIDTTADVFRTLSLQRQGAEDKVFVDTYELELNKKYGAIEQEMLNSPDTKKPDFVNIFDKRLSEAQNEVMEGLIGSGQFNPSKEGRDAATHSAMNARTASARRAAVTAHNQNVLGQVDTVNENVLAIARVAGVYGNLDDGMERAERSISSLRGILAPDKYEALRKSSRETVLENVVRAHTDRGEFEQARMLLDRNRGFAANSVERTFADAASKAGLPPSYLVAVARIESNGNNAAKPVADPKTGIRTSASGYFGFTADTGKQYGLPGDASQATPEQQATAAAKLATDNASVLRKGIGREPTTAELYLGHFLGAGDAVKVLNSDSSTPVESIIGAKSVASNTKLLSGKTAGEVVGMANAKMTSAGAGGSGYEMDEAKRITMLNAIETKQHQLEERTRTERTRVMKETGEALLKDAFSRSDKGTLDRSYVEIIRPFVSPAEYHGLTKILTKGAEADNQDAIIDLVNNVDKEDPETFTKRANRYIETHQLKTETYTTMLTRNRTAYKDDKPASPYRRGREYIEKYLDVGQLTGSQAVPIANMATARAKMEYDSWIEANPKAQPYEVVEEAQNISRRAATIQLDGMKMANPVSKYFGPKSRNAVTMEDITAAGTQLLADKEAKRITDMQYSVEMSLLKNWREIIELENSRAAQPAPPKKTGRP